MRCLVFLAVAACATDPADDEPVIVSKVAYREIPYSRSMLTIGVPCWEMEIPAPHDCSISIVDANRTSETLMPSCDASPDARPCWRISVDAAVCQDAKHQYLDIAQTDWPVGQHYLIAQCVSR